MSTGDPALISLDLARVTAHAGSVTFDDWTHATTSFVWTARGISTCAAVAYNPRGAAVVNLGQHHETVQVPLMRTAKDLFKAQNSEWVGINCSGSRSGEFQVDYSHNLNEAIRWVSDAFDGGSSPSELVEVLRPTDPVEPAPAPQQPPTYPAFIPDAGLCITTKNAMSRPGRVRFAVRTAPINSADTGWQFFSPFDSPEYLADPDNAQIADYNLMCSLEPALIGIWNHPIGSDYDIIHGDRGIEILDSRTGRPVPREAMFIPPQFR